MTAEVVVMNRLGVALASDSAASVLVGGRTKLYHADKLFMLSNVRPVAVMVYNSSSLLQVPWETIIKSFRTELGNTAFDTLEEYAAALIAYLNGSPGMFPEEVQKVMFLHTLGVLFKDIDREIRRDALEKYFADGADDGHNALREAAAPCIARVFEEWESSPDLDVATFPAGTAMSYATRLSGEINRLINENFKESVSYLGVNEVHSLTRLAKLVIQKQKMVTDTCSGLVLAGFGEKQFFPVLQSYKIGGVFEGHLKYVLEETLRVDVEHPAVIKPFAQSVTVEAFLYGVNPQLYLDFAKAVLETILGLPDAVIDGFPGIGKKRKDDYRGTVASVATDAAAELVEQFQELLKARHYEPVLASIAHLPKNELAHVASTLVNLSSFQKRVSMIEDETVGGPVDVAVITKGDGFIWVDRKHYFKPELNTHFFRNRRAGLPPPAPGDAE